MSHIFLSYEAVAERTTLTRSEIDHLVSAGTFPLSDTMAGQTIWWEVDIERWIDALPIAEDITEQAFATSEPQHLSPRKIPPS